ncbi:hypothetical protein ACIPR7_18090 [Pectobacterium parvum]|uniref:hypothetical protein n=1 Tax=Pectobacterium parvum TaxID=2778550 RepID=UPI00382E8DC5
MLTYLARNAGKDIDVAQSGFVTVFNMAIAGGAAAGGVVVSHLGAGSIPVFFIISAALALVLFCSVLFCSVLFWQNMRNK